MSEDNTRKVTGVSAAEFNESLDVVIETTLRNQCNDLTIENRKLNDRLREADSFIEAHQALVRQNAKLVAAAEAMRAWWHSGQSTLADVDEALRDAIEESRQEMKSRHPTLDHNYCPRCKEQWYRCECQALSEAQTEKTK